MKVLRKTAIALLVTFYASSAAAQQQLAPGPCLDKRKEVLTYLDRARKAGIGTKPYETAMESIENNIKAGQGEEEIKKQVYSLCSSLAQQVNNLKYLKVARPHYKAVSGNSGGGGSAGGPVNTADPANMNTAEMEAYMLTLVNKHRTEAGLGVVGPNSNLAAIAKAHAADMVKRNFFNHVNPDGKDPQMRARDGGWTGGVFENIAFCSNHGSANANTESADKTLMNSPPHRATILNNSVSTVGIGIVADPMGGIKCCQLFAP